MSRDIVRRSGPPLSIQACLLLSGSITGYDAYVTLGLTLEITGRMNDAIHNRFFDSPATSQIARVRSVEYLTLRHLPARERNPYGREAAVALS